MLDEAEEIDPRYTRVTTVLYPLSGLHLVPQFILKAAAKRGEIVHNTCSAIMEDIGYPSYEDKYAGYIDSFLKWNEGKKHIENPKRLYCDTHMITGEADDIYEENGKLVLVDWKTPEKESKTWISQGSAYAYLCKQAGYDISRIEFVKLSRKGDFPTTFVYENRFDKFLRNLETYNEYFKDMKIDDLIKNYE